MKDRLGPLVSLGWILAAAFLLASTTAGVGVEHVEEDVRLSGKAVYVFEDAGEQVTVVLGEFRLVVGERVVSARDAVVWVRDVKDVSGLVHEITAYLEGDVKVTEPGGGAVTDKVMLVTVRHRGRLTVAGGISDRPLKDFPLYKRAGEVRDSARTRAETKPAPHEAPALVIVRGEGEREPAGTEATPPDTGTSAAVPSGPLPRVRATKPAGAAPADTQPAGMKPAPAPAPRTIQPVNVYIQDFSTRLLEDGTRLTIASGNVYLSQGDPDSGLFLELRCQTAVIFSEKRVVKKDVRVPYARDVAGASLEDDGDEEREVVTAVYLEGDVVIARGERTLRGTRAYYDFITDRAIILDAVFRTVQEQRNIPVYIRAVEARTLSVREVWFRDAKVSTSDFHTPTYHVGAREIYMMDNTPYDEKGVQIGPRRWHAKIKHGTLNVRSAPLLYWPYSSTDFEQGHTSLRKATVGRNRRLGWGGETEWHLFRLLGLVRPEGYRGRLDLNYYERGPFVGARVWYTRKNYSGYSMAYGMLDQEQEDDFGEERKNVSAPSTRGRVLMRHKHYLPKDWTLQFELSYLCDRNFLEQFFRDEFVAGKEQETLLYARKQRDQWAFTSLLKYRLNRFQRQTESVPDLGFYLTGQPLAEDLVNVYSESHAGVKHFREPNFRRNLSGSRHFGRFDTRNEIDTLLRLGPVRVVPYAAGRATYWDDAPTDGEHCRTWGQLGVRASTDIWRVYNNAESRLWDVHRLKHVMTPEVAAFIGDTGGVMPGDLFPMDPDIEEHMRRQGGVAIALYQRLLTKRGPAGNRESADWMRFNIIAGFYDNGADTQTSDGRYFMYRPEYSLGRNHINAEYFWNISDATMLLADANYDIDSDAIRRLNVGLSVVRDPRLKYYVGWRWLRDLDSSVGTLGFNYKLTRKYTVNVFEQFDFDFDGRKCLVTEVGITRKFPRWYMKIAFTYDRTDDQDDVAVRVTFWPEGIPEVRLGAGRMSLLGRSDMN